LRFLAISDTEFTSFQQSDDDDGLFAELDNFGSSTIGDELEEYLKAPTIATVKDPLAWWHAVGDTPLAQMGRDFMSAPGDFTYFPPHTDLVANFVVSSASSCDVERAFSRGGLNVTKLRHALSEDSTHASTVFHAWSEFPELIPSAEIIQTFQDKAKRLGTQKKDSQASQDSSAMDVDESDDGFDLDG